MKLVQIFIIAVVIFLCSCEGRDKHTGDSSSADSLSAMRMATESNQVSSDVDSSQGTVLSQSWDGTYKGYLPCADCEGIETVIVLNKDLSYTKSEKRIGSNETDAVTVSGKFKQLKDSRIELEGIFKGAARYFIGEGKLVQVDDKNRVVRGPLADKFGLKKVK